MNPRRGLPASPSLEQLWSDEVRYLHSLWHQGPPRQPNPNPNPNPKPKANNYLRPCSSTSFKKETQKKKKKTPQVSDVVWPCKPEPEPRNFTSWPEPVSQSGPSTRPLSAEEQEKYAALHLQQKGLKASQDFFARNIDSDNEGEENGEEEEEEEDWMEETESEEFDFFLGIFKEDSELRGYYEKNCERGEFCCFACSGIGKKSVKRFKNCVALVQHSMSISKTKRKRAHRAFGQAICRVLGWDIKRLPNIVLSMDEPLGRILSSQAETKVDLEECGGTSGNVVNSVNDDIAGSDQNQDPHNESMDFQEHEKKKRGKKKKNNSNEDCNPPLVSNLAWPCDPKPEPRKGTDWPKLDSQICPSTRPVSTEEEAKLTALQLQQKGLKASQGFFSSMVGSDNEEEDEDDSMESDNDESEELEFFLGIFMEDSELRDYYEKNCKGGEFCCLACSGIGKKAGKRFKTCIALVQHSTTISKTKRKRAHRAFGQAICQILGWDIKQFPNNVFSIGEPLGHNLIQAETKMGSKEDDANDQKKDLDKEIVVTTGINNLVSSKKDGPVGEGQGLHREIVDSVIIDKENSED